MPDLQALLERIEWLDKAATPGPWVKDKSQLYDYVEPHPYDLYEAGEDDPPLASDILPHNAEFIALARTALPAMSKALRAVIANLGQLEVKYDDYNAIDHIVNSITHELRQTITKVLGDGNV